MLLHPSSRLIAHLDMNSFFATVEQQAHPSWRGRPLGVCAYLHESGCVIAASIEAKRRGMRVGMRVNEARVRVPDAVFVENDPAKYRAVIARVMAILRQTSERVEQYSIDEAFIELTGWCRDAAEAAWVMARIMWRVRAEVGEWLSCSVGIGPNKLLAKLGSDFKKPHGLTILGASERPAILAAVPVQDVWGIGPRLGRRLQALRIMTALELQQADTQRILHHFGKMGFWLQAGLQGCDLGGIAGESRPVPRSVGHSYCLPSRVWREGRIEAVCLRLTDRVGARVRRYGQLAGRLSLQIGLKEAVPAASAEKILSEPTADAFTLMHTSLKLLHELWNGADQISFLAITATHLSRYDDRQLKEPMQKETAVERRMRITAALDLVRARHGDQALVFGRMLQAKEDAPDRIGFRQL